MFRVYVLKSGNDGNYYIGHTNNLANRLLRHNNGYVKSTRNRRPLTLVYEELFKTRSEAMKREKFLKSGEGHTFLRDNL